jgi:MoxR-like ATPase
MAAMLGNTVYTITLHENSSADELRGGFLPKAGLWDWFDGVAIRAWREGAILIIEEINRASDEVKSFLHAICDSEATASITLPTGEKVKPAQGFKVIATMNGEPEELHEALRSRFPVTIKIDQPHPDAIAELPEDLRALANNTVCHREEKRRISLRHWYAFANLRNELNEELAATAVFGARAEDVLSALRYSSDV